MDHETPAFLRALKKVIERERFRAHMRTFMDECKPGVVNDLNDVESVAVTRAKDWKIQNNEYWEDPQNKSYVRVDVTCDTCKEVVVMSNWLYKRYKELPTEKRPKVCCSECLVEQLEKEGKSPNITISNTKDHTCTPEPEKPSPC